MKKNISVSILNQNITIRSDREESYVQEVADFVKSKIDDVMGHSKNVSVVTACILALMNVADEFFEAKSSKDRLLGEVKNKIDQMISTIEDLKQNK